MTVRTLCLLLIWSAIGRAQAAPPDLATVAITPLDSFGRVQSNCRVQFFVQAEHVAESGGGRGTEWDYATRFDGLVGRGVPFGRYYTAVTCDPGSWGGGDWVSVSARETFLVLAFWHHKGDYHTGSEPRLTVSYSANGVAKVPWAKVVGAYLDFAETARVDPATGKAGFYYLSPGKYLLLILEEEKVTCVKELDFLHSPAAIDLGPGCAVESLANVRTAPGSTSPHR